MDLRVHADDRGAWLDFGQGALRAAIGPGGIAVKGGEGDGITPLGSWPVREILYRADHMLKPRTSLPLRAIQPDDGWCDAPGDPNYNRPVKLPYAAGHEKMWRDDALYDLLVVLGFNDDPVLPGRGSAIFLHVAKPDYAPTAGCVALAKEDLLAAVMQLGPGDRVVIG